MSQLKSPGYYAEADLKEPLGDIYYRIWYNCVASPLKRVSDLKKNENTKVFIFPFDDSNYSVSKEFLEI